MSAPAAADESRRTTDELIDAWVAKMLSTAPALTAAQIERLRALFASGRVSDAG